MDYSYKFSIIIAVYNTESYIAETLDSIINQSMNFEKHVEIILVNDGSTDNSEKICKEYVSKYKNNIKYFYKANGGVSTARNLGISKAKGKYFNFLDSDDLLHPKALQVVYDFFEMNKYEIDMVTLPISLFERETGLYTRYAKFNNTSYIVDLELNPQNYVFSCAASFYKRILFKEFKFNTNLKTAEDLYLNTKIFMNNPKFGIISADEAVYYYRKRIEENSITNSNEYGDDWFTYVFDYLYKGIMKHLKNSKQKIPTFIKYILLYNVEKRISMPHFIEKKALQNFFKISENILSNVDDDIILNYETKDYFSTALLFMIKYKEYNVSKCFKVDKDYNLVKNRKPLINLNNYKFRVSSIKFDENNLILEGFINDIIPDNFKMFYVNSNGFNEIIKTKSTNNFLQIRFFDIIVGQAYNLKAVIPFTKIGNTLINICINNYNIPIEIDNAYNEESLKHEQLVTHNNKDYMIKIIDSMITVE